MKKLKYCLFILFGVAVVFSGCAGNKYLRTQSTNLSPATFYSNNYIASLEEFQSVGTSANILSSEVDRLSYKNYMKSTYQFLPEERCFVSVLDFLCAKNQTEGELRQDSKNNTKIYEYSTIFKSELETISALSSNASNYSNIKAVVVVKSANQNKELTAYMFYMNKLTNAEISTLLESVDLADVTYIFTQNKYVEQTQTYTLTYKSNQGKTGCSVEATFSTKKGCLTFTAKTYMGSDNTPLTIKKSIYKYSSNIVGVRSVSNYKDGSQMVNIVYEQLSKDFYKKLKLGEVKNEQEIFSMETMQEDKLAKPNSSDNLGFEFVYDLQNDEQTNKIVCTKYGGAK